MCYMRMACAGLVCTYGEDRLLKVWDINHLGNAPNQRPAFSINVWQRGGHAKESAAVFSILSAGRPSRREPTQLLTGMSSQTFADLDCTQVSSLISCHGDACGKNNAIRGFVCSTDMSWSSIVRCKACSKFPTKGRTLLYSP